ncbi:hypothetical protein HDU96_004949, partial [Phlyctochytrium bullatum]
IAPLPLHPLRPIRGLPVDASTPSAVRVSSGLSYLGVVQLQRLNELAAEAYMLHHPPADSPSPLTPRGTVPSMAITPYALRSRALPSSRVHPLDFGAIDSPSAPDGSNPASAPESGLSEILDFEKVNPLPPSAHSSSSAVACSASPSSHPPLPLDDSRAPQPSLPVGTTFVPVQPGFGLITYSIGFPGLFTMSAKEARERVRDTRLVSTEPRAIWRFFYALETHLAPFVTAPKPSTAGTGTTAATTATASTPAPRAFATWTDGFLHCRSDQWFSQLPAATRSDYWMIVQSFTTWSDFESWVKAKCEGYGLDDWAHDVAHTSWEYTSEAALNDLWHALNSERSLIPPSDQPSAADLKKTLVKSCRTAAFKDHVRSQRFSDATGALC